MGENDQDYKDKMLELIKLEYNAMREEINNAHSHIFLTMQISLGAVGVILPILHTFKDDLVVIHFFLLILFPWISACAVLTILAESQRLKRAGDYICFLEEKVKLLWQPSDTLSQYEKVWERRQNDVEDWLRIKHTDLKLSDPLCFEHWIRCLDMGEFSYGRSSFIFVMRFALIYIAIPTASIAASMLMYIDKTVNNIYYDAAIRSLPSFDVGVFFMIGCLSIKICRENKVVHIIQKQCLHGKRQ